MASGSSLNSPQIQSLERKLTEYGLRITGVLRYEGSRGRAVAEFQKKIDKMLAANKSHH